jgi:hypothetical protein
VTHTFYGVVKAHEHITPDPKNNPQHQVGLVKVKVSPQAMFAEKPTPAQLIVETGLLEELKLGSKVRIRLDVYQGELELEREQGMAEDGRDAKVTIEVPGEPPVHTTVAAIEKAVKSGRLRRNRADAVNAAH